MRARRVNVHHPTPETRVGTDDKVYYGQTFSGAIFDHIEFVDEPRSQTDRQWIHEHLMTRASPECILTDGRKEWRAWPE